MAIGLGTLIIAASTIYSGITSLRSGNRQAEDLKAQGQIILNESFREASIVREEGRVFAANQSLQFIGAGVELVGSALITLEHTRRMAGQEATAIEDSGIAKATLATRQANVKRSEGRASLVGGILSTAAAFVDKE